MFAAEGLLFDLDGTLIDSTPVTEECWRAWAREFGVGEERLWAAHAHGRPSADIVAELLPEDLRKEGQERIERLEVERADGVVALPGAHALLESLPRERWAVVTSCTRALARARMAPLEVEPPLMVTADDISRGKPDPEPYELGARLLGAPAGACVALEDAPAGLASARAAGARTIALLTSHHATELQADAVVANLASVSVEPGAGGSLVLSALAEDAD
ncbi:HAD-IA family hydrolase [Spinactinospora alkalitolerans]|nr:HAD-IA family hydrolase [Spinactinospora alkalitolerans]